FFVGAAEAGFFPGVIVYLTYWFRNQDRAKAVAVFYAANPLSYVIGSPIAGLLLGISWLGLKGWRWLFVMEGIPAIIFGVITIVKRLSGLSDLKVTLIAALPYIAAFVVQQLNGWHSDRTGERRWHATLPLFICAITLTIAVLLGSHPLLSIALFVLVGASFYGFQPCFWAVPTMFLSESAAAASIGLINSVGNLGGFIGPFVVGYLVTRTHSFNAGLFYLVGSLVVAGVLMLTVGARRPLPLNAHGNEKQ